MDIKSSKHYVKDINHAWNIAGPHSRINTYDSIRTYLRYRESTPNPRYKQIIKDEGNATTPLYAYTQYGSTQPGLIRITYPDKVSVADTFCGISLPVPMTTNELVLSTNGLVSSAEARATAQVYKRIAEYQTPFQGQVFAGELREVLDLVRNPFAKSAKLTDSFIRTLSADGLKLKQGHQLGTKVKRIGRNVQRNLTGVSKAVADSWLEYSFAVSPLMKDVAGLITLAADIAHKRDHETIRAYGKSESATSISSFASGIGYNIQYNLNTINRVENIIRCGMTARFIDTLGVKNNTNPWIDSIDDFSSLPITAWELMPFSFLVDYFVNVQDILQSAIVSQSGIAYTSNSLIRTRETTQITGRIMPGTVHPAISACTPVIPKTVVSGVRSVNRTATLLGIPPVVFSLPGSNVRYANIAALLTKLL